MKNSLALIVPCFNEAKRLPQETYLNYLKDHTIRFLFVDDGSQDETKAIFEKLRMQYPEKIDLLILNQNIGKAQAVRAGVNHLLSKKNDLELLGYWDADLAVPLSEIDRMLELFNKNDKLKLVLGSRVKLLGYNIVRHPLRHYVGRVFATFASLFLNMPVYDTQCGAKIMKTELAREVFQAPLQTRWIFDVEILLRCRLWLRKTFGPNNIEKYINEIPLLSWQEIGGSKVKLRHYFMAFLDFIKLIVIKIATRARTYEKK